MVSIVPARFSGVSGHIQMVIKNLGLSQNNIFLTTSIIFLTIKFVITFLSLIINW